MARSDRDGGSARDVAFARTRSFARCRGARQLGRGESIAIEPRVLPEPERDWKRIDVELLPPCGLITRAMKFAVMDPTNRDGELVAHSVAKRTRLGKREVMGIRRHAAAHKTRLSQHELSMLL